MATLNEAILQILATPQYKPTPLKLNEEISGASLRADRSQKGTGYFGVLRRPEGGVSTEISIGVNLGGREIEIPALVPTLTKDEVDYLLKTPVNQPIPKPIFDKATLFANQRLTQGLSPFAANNEIPYGIATAPLPVPYR